MEGDLKDSTDRSTVDQLTNDARDVRARNTDDPLFFQNSGHPKMTLVISVLTGKNSLMESFVYVKLGFINGKCECPSEDSPPYEHWVRVDCIVTS